MEEILVNVDSKFRNKKIFPNSGQFILNQPEIIKNVKSIRVESIEIPNTFYFFQNSRFNTSFKIIMEEANIGQVIDIILREGNYTTELLIDFIQINYFDVINTLTDNFTTQIERYNFQIYLHPESNLITISNLPGTRIINDVSTDVGGAKFSLDLSRSQESPYLSLGQYLGFQNLNYSNQNTYQSETMLNIQIEPYCYLRVNNYGKLYNHLNDKRIIAKIPLDRVKNYVVYSDHNNISKEYHFIQPINIDKWNIEVLDLYGNVVNLLGQNISFTLKLTLLRNSHLYSSQLNGFFNPIISQQLTPFTNPITYFPNDSFYQSVFTSPGLIPNGFTFPGLIPDNKENF